MTAPDSETLPFPPLLLLMSARVARAAGGFSLFPLCYFAPYLFV